MIIQKVNVLVGSRQAPEHQDYKLAVYKCGPDALPVTEVAILQAINGLESVTEVSPAGEYETTKEKEWQRLVRKYPRAYHLCYPSAAVPMPKDISGLELEAHQFAKVPPKEHVDDIEGPIARGQTMAVENAATGGDPRLAIKKRLKEEFGIELPFGNYGLPRLQGMLEAELAKAGKAA